VAAVDVSVQIGRQPAVTRFLPQLSTTSWALLIVTAWMVILWATTASLAPIVMWFIGLFVVVLLRLMSTQKQNVHIYGPNGKDWIVSALAAERRVRNGWSYEPQAPQP
jgi:hypothetical protein